jgi:hypothetical protein
MIPDMSDYVQIKPLSPVLIVRTVCVRHVSQT